MIGFRDATAADLPVIVALLADDALGRSRENPATPLPDCYRRGFEAMLDQGGVIILALDGDADGAPVVGCLQLNLLHGVSQRGQCRAQVEGVRVASSRRGTGAGTALMAEAIRRAREAGAGLMQLTTNLSRADARRFYERLGFQHTHAGMKRTLDR